MKVPGSVLLNDFHEVFSYCGSEMFVMSVAPSAIPCRHSNDSDRNQQNRATILILLFHTNVFEHRLASIQFRTQYHLVSINHVTVIE